MLTTADRLELRRAFLAMVSRRQRPGTGSNMDALMRKGRIVMRWWNDAHEALAGIPHAVAGAVAANHYRPPRHTDDIDFAVRLADLASAEAALTTAGFTKAGPLQLSGGLEGCAWERDGHETDLLGLPEQLGIEAIEEAQTNLRGDLPHLRREHVVVTKMISSRTQDLADIQSIMGVATDEEVGAVREAISRFGGTEDLEDLDQMITMGRLERGIRSSRAR